MTEPLTPTAWLAARGHRPFAFQREVWRAIARGHSGLLHASTGAGKTLAVWLGALARLGAPARRPRAKAAQAAQTAESTEPAPPLTALWITPMRALAADTTRALAEPLPALAPRWTIGQRTGDTSSSQRAAQERRLPTALVSTPESLALLLTRADARERFAKVRLVVVDEWHELMGNKRGVMVQLLLARLAHWRAQAGEPPVMVWGLSATLANLSNALDTLTGGDPRAVLVRGKQDKTLAIRTLLPPRADRFAWAGHLGMGMLDHVVAAIEDHASTLVFTNVRSQAEQWYQALLAARPDWAGVIALHHGSLDAKVREWVELSLKEGALKAVVCTSSLDLGVDFSPVEQVLQIGSAKGVARLMQRAGRSGHAPGRASRIVLVPTHSLEIVEAAALKQAVRQGWVEPRESPRAPLDLLAQHLVTVALGGGFRPEELLPEIRRAWAYRDLSEADWQWALDFVRRGGSALAVYPDFQRVVPDEGGVWRVPDARLARRHRVNIGVIVSDAAMRVQFIGSVSGGASLGQVEESFIARLKPGDCFIFSGRVLELVRVHEMTAYVRRAPPGRAAVPRWGGGRMALSDALAQAMLARLADADQGRFDGPEMRAVAPLLQLQARWSQLPTPSRLVAETLQSREGHHLFVYPFGGRHVHLALAGWLGWRAAQIRPTTFSMATNDYGLELLSATPVDWAPVLADALAPIDAAQLTAEVLASLNAGELARRRFREIARISGLIFQSHPGERRSSRQLQASSSLYYEVFDQYDPDNRLLAQARQELLDAELDVQRLAATLERLRGQQMSLRPIDQPTPLAFPLMVERFRERLTNEPLAERLQRMVQALEAAAGKF